VEVHLMRWFCLNEYIKNTRTCSKQLEHCLACVVMFKDFCENSLFLATMYFGSFIPNR